MAERSSHESYLLNGTNRLRYTKPATIPDSVLHFNSKLAIRDRSTLALLVTAILADNPNHALATNNFAITTNAFYGSTYFHDFTYLYADLPQQTGATVTLEVGLFHQPLILVRHHQRLHLGHEIHDYHHDNQQGRAAKIERDVPVQNQKFR